mgnify:CR=1 FL=1
MDTEYSDLLLSIYYETDEELDSDSDQLVVEKGSEGVCRDVQFEGGLCGG